MEREIANIRERLATLEQDEKSIHRRLDYLESMVDSIHTLATTSVELAAELKAMRKDVNDIDGRVEAIEETPKKRYDTVIAAIITTVVGVLIGYLINK